MIYLKNLTEEETIAVIFNWIARRRRGKQDLSMRIRDPKNNDTYVIWIKSSKDGALEVKSITKQLPVENNMLYAWPVTVTLCNLSQSLIEAAMTEADCLNIQQAIVRT